MSKKVLRYRQEGDINFWPRPFSQFFSSAQLGAIASDFLSVTDELWHAGAPQSLRDAIRKTCPTQQMPSVSSAPIASWHLWAFTGIRFNFLLTCNSSKWKWSRPECHESDFDGYTCINTSKHKVHTVLHVTVTKALSSHHSKQNYFVKQLSNQYFRLKDANDFKFQMRGELIAAFVSGHRKLKTRIHPEPSKSLLDTHPETSKSPSWQRTHSKIPCSQGLLFQIFCVGSDECVTRVLRKGIQRRDGSKACQRVWVASQLTVWREWFQRSDRNSRLKSPDCSRSGIFSESKISGLSEPSVISDFSSRYIV